MGVFGNRRIDSTTSPTTTIPITTTQTTTPPTTTTPTTTTPTTTIPTTTTTTPTTTTTTPTTTTTFPACFTSTAYPPVPTTTWNQSCIDHHNAIRAKHNCTPLVTFDVEASKTAQHWAEQLATYGPSIGPNGHSTRLGPGENLYSTWTGNIDEHEGHVPITFNLCQKAVMQWHSHICKYDFNNILESYDNDAVRHFTQVVWKDSWRVGCGLAHVKEDHPDRATVPYYGIRYYVVCHYSPPGNVAGQYMDQVEGYADGEEPFTMCM
ncbi:unnamed protein product [Owenia fusiformis]|uniref:Uncharacterized protein n=1 Tax=Owenia fusiformis TaxID=6347 RepID=A0A8J1TXI0_OWEFU|nr:unnamed protein product [Owenia fusiformis]